MNADALQLITEQLSSLKSAELKKICRVLRQKKPIKYSKLHKSEMIREITNFLDFSAAFQVPEKMKRKTLESIHKRLNELVEIASQKRFRQEDVSKEIEEYKRLRLCLKSEEEK